MLLAGVPHIPQVPSHVAEGVRHEPIREREIFYFRKLAPGHSVSDPNPDWIRIRSGPVIAGVPHIPQVPSHVAEGVRHEPTRERERFDIIKLSLGHNVFSDPNPDWIRIQTGQWIRARIQNRDPDSGGQKLPKKIEKL